MRKQRAKAYQSSLREHFQTIKCMRRARNTWRQISEHLATEHALHVTPQWIQEFFKLATKRNRLPLGFPPQNASEPQPQAAVSQSVVSVSSEDGQAKRGTTHNPTNAETLVETRKGQVLKHALQKRLQIEAEQQKEP